MKKYLKKIIPDFIRRILSDYREKNIRKKEQYYLKKLSSAALGSNDWLIGTELKFGGFEYRVSRNKFSPHD